MQEEGVGDLMVPSIPEISTSKQLPIDHLVLAQVIAHRGLQGSKDFSHLPTFMAPEKTGVDLKNNRASLWVK